MNFKTHLILLLFSLILLGCSNENSESLMDNSPIIGNATYIQNVKKIVDNNCIVCHATIPLNGAPMSLVTYDQVKNAVLTRGLTSRITLENGDSSLMPRGGPKLPQSTIEVILKWQKDGLLEQ